MRELSAQTVAVHGAPRRNMSDQIRYATAFPPIHQNAAFEHETPESLASVFQGKQPGHIYSRISNPTVAAFESRINDLEGGIGSIAFASGMAALTVTLLSLLDSGDELVSGSSIFGGTAELYEHVLGRYGVTTRFADPTSIEDIRASITDKTKLIFLEAIGNPKLDVPNITETANLANEHEIPLIIDTTLLSPVLVSAKALGASIVVSSCTKYISGSGRALGGIITDTGTFDWKRGRPRAVAEAAATLGAHLGFLSIARKRIAQNVGGCLSPFDAFLHLLGVETLGVRMERHCNNAMSLARRLSADKRVVHVCYPRLESHPQHHIAFRQFTGGCGGLLTIRLGSKDRCYRFLNALTMPKHLANLGDTRTLVIHPASTIYHSLPAERRESAGAHDDLIRISVGIESYEDIEADFDQALEEVEHGAQ